MVKVLEVFALKAGIVLCLALAAVAMVSSLVRGYRKIAQGQGEWWWDFLGAATGPALFLTIAIILWAMLPGDH